MKLKIKIYAIFLISLAGIFGIVLLVLSPKDYNIVYERNGLQVEELFHKQIKAYELKIIKDDVSYEFGLQHKYVNKKYLVDNVKIYEAEEGVSCVLPEGKLEFYPICYDGEKFIDYELTQINDDFYKRTKSNNNPNQFKNIDVTNSDKEKYLIWANKGYYFLSQKENKELMFLSNDFYYNNLSYKMDEYVITPNYDEEYNFSSFNVINMKKGKSTIWAFDEKISYNSYFLGDRNGFIYLFDRKEKKEYAINPQKKKIEIVSKNGIGKIWNDEWEEVSTVKMASNDYVFNEAKLYNFKVLNGKLLVNGLNMKNEILVSKKKVDKIIDANKDSVYYLVNDEVYRFSFKTGEELVIKYSEFKFNNTNALYVFKS